MVPDEIQSKRDRLKIVSDQVRWCDNRQLEEENMPGVAPGGFLNAYQWYVVGTTLGGHALVVHPEDPGVYFADYTWYDDDSIDFQDYANGDEWVRLPFTEENVRRSLYSLASSPDDFLQSIDRIDAVLQKIG